MNIKSTFKSSILILSIIISLLNVVKAQTLGLLLNDTLNTFKGYTVFAPKHNTMTYIINNQGQKVHEWSASTYDPGQAVYLLPNGNLLRTCQVQGQLGTGGGEGGRIEEYSWNDSLVWSMDYSTSTYMQHHDIKKLPNGNIIMLIVEKKLMSDIIASGFDTSNFQPEVTQHGFMLPDAIVEIQPTYPSGGTVVWQWHVWNHLVQNRDATKLNYGVPSQHPELIDVMGDHKKEPLFWNHMNSIDYNPSLNQIAVSVRGNSEVWLIDHGTTTAQAASHTGGTHNKGGDLLYRWGNPITYGAGTAANEMYYQQHDAEWIKSDCPGAGHIMCFNKGIGRNYSTIDEIIPPIDTAGNYSLVAGSAYGPTALCWTYQASPPTSLFAEDISGAQRLPNGNTLINDGPHGALMEVTAAGTMVWKYINPVQDTGPLTQGDTASNDPTHPGEKMNAIFRVYRYPLAYTAFTGRDLTPTGVIELNPNGINENKSNIPAIYPNPFTNKIALTNIKGDENYELFNSIGKCVWAGKGIEQQNFSALAKGIYFLKVNTLNSMNTFKLIKQ